MSSPIMKAIVVENGGASLAWRDVPRPEPQDDEVLVRVIDVDRSGKIRLSRKEALEAM